MEPKRPRSREKQVSGPAKTVRKQGPGLGSGPVGSSDRPSAPSSSASTPNRSGGSRKSPSLLVLLLVLLLGGGGGLGALLGGQSAPTQQQPQQQQQQIQSGTSSSGSTLDLSALLGGLGGGSVSSGWQGEANTGTLNTSVDPAARTKYTQLRGNGRDTVTLMVYMCGTDLESRNGMGTADLQEMIAADLGSSVNLLVYTGGCSSWRNQSVSSSTNQIWQVRNGGIVCLESDLGSRSMTNPDTLTNYIQYGTQNFPANRYGLILWDHGGGAISGYGYDERFPATGSMALSGLSSALDTAQVSFDFIGFDACLMATAETALTLTPYADYLIASEETEPGVGWYYTDWLTALGRNPSLPTVELGRQIADSFVDECARRCKGQLTTLSVLDLAELEQTLPKPLADFSKAASSLISSQQYQTLAAARGNAREFAQSSRIDHVDLVHLARNLGTREANALADTLLSAVKYNRTSSNMTNAYGLSIYFPYQNAATVDKAVASYQQIGMEPSYISCIRQFAQLEVSGQAASGGTASPLPMLLGGSAASDGLDAAAIAQLLGAFLGGRFDRVSGLDASNTAFLDGLDPDQTAAYLTETRFASEQLVWDTSGDVPTLTLSNEQWALVDTLDLNLFYDDGEGFIDLGLDNVFDFDDNGRLLGTHDGSWLAIDGQPVAYYHTATVDDGTHYTITGYVPVLHNRQPAQLLLTFDDANPSGFVAGVRPVYDGETETIAKSFTELEAGDVLEFLCDYYAYDGTYQDSYRLGDPLTVSDAPLTLSNVPLEGSVQATFRFTDRYCQSYWTPAF